MPHVKVSVKWKKETFDDVEVDTDAPPSALRQKLQDLTGVPADRQKIMAKGAWRGFLSDDTSLSGLTNGAKLTLMGTAETISKPTEEVKFVEDMPPDVAAAHGTVNPAGLENLGNTCYMNSTVEALRYVPELRDSLKELAEARRSELAAVRGSALAAGTGLAGPGSVSRADALLGPSLGDLYNRLDSSAEAIQPAEFLGVLRSVNPIFAERGQTGWKQQDSEEFQNCLFSQLARTLTQLPDSVKRMRTGRRTKAIDRLLANANDSTPPNLIDTLFGIDMEVTYTCAETDAEPASTRHEGTRTVVCNIQGGAGSTVQINHLHEGILLGLDGEVEKHSDVLGRNAVWKKQQRMDRLPPYLCVQFMRFFWKATPEVRDQAGVKCKMLRPVNFPADNFDVYDFCSKRVQRVLSRAREAHDAAESARLGGSSDAGAAASGGGGSSAANDTKMEDDEEEELRRAMAMSLGAESGAGSGEEDIGVGLPEQCRGIYELFAVVTHKGRSADAGHYMAWVRQSGDNWLVFDDDVVSSCKTENVLQLRGGGDRDMAYFVFYRIKQ